MFCISFVYLLIIIYMYPTCKISKICMPAKLLVVHKIWLKWPICPNQHQGPLLEILHIPLLSVMTLHYQRLYQISSLEPNSGPATLRGGAGGYAPLPPSPPPLFFRSKRKKKRKKRKSFKAKTIKRTFLFSVLWPLHFEIHFAGPVI